VPTGLLRNGAGDAGRKCTVTRNDDAAWLRRMLENVMAATVSFDPTLALEPSHDGIAICVWLGHSGCFECANIGASVKVNQYPFAAC
jgi:hypothetical protein